MEDMKNGKRSSFSGKLGYVLAAAGASDLTAHDENP